MRISDWSSDVCSSDLSGAAAPAAGRLGSGCRARDRRYSAGGRRPGRCGRFDMTLSSLPQWLRPAPDSVVAIDIRVGKSQWVEAVHLMWSIWVFITRSEEHTSELQSLMRISYAVFCLQTKNLRNTKL